MTKAKRDRERQRQRDRERREQHQSVCEILNLTQKKCHTDAELAGAKLSGCSRTRPHPTQLHTERAAISNAHGEVNHRPAELLKPLQLLLRWY